MWYVKNEIGDVFFKSNDLRKTQNYANWYNDNFKFSSQRAFRFVISDFTGFILFGEDKIDINYFTQKSWLFNGDKFVHPLSIKSFSKRHQLYRELKYKLICKLCKKYHVWSFNQYGRKCDGFDF